ncbi:MAG: hypothetical protein FWH55_09230 [Oscillospiraceae bacterium]|nr:hypothetical protein [Oscillospiraceae bacterium]
MYSRKRVLLKKQRAVIILLSLAILASILAAPVASAAVRPPAPASIPAAVLAVVPAPAPEQASDFAPAPASVPDSAPAPEAAPAPDPAPYPESVPAQIPATAPAQVHAPESARDFAPASAPELAPASVPASAPELAPASVPAPAPYPALAHEPAPAPYPALAPELAPEPAPYPAPVPAPSPADDDFVIPVPIANPQTPDEEFFNMRLQFFLPETEPLIKDTFGSALRFENEAFWEYESYYSRAISFATNLPTLAKIEYGPDTNYGFTTDQTESYYYQHLFHLTGLTPANTYHYRIKVKGADGAFLTSEDYTFTTPAIPADIIRIPQDLEDQSLPYRLTGNDKKYLLTQDIFAPNGGILLGGYNVTLDLGGHTIIYDNELNPIINEFLADNAGDYMYNEDFTYGIRSALWNFQNQKIFNGVIIQGANGGTGLCGDGYNPLYFTHTSNVEIGGIIADYYGDSVGGIASDYDSYVHHNVIYDRGSVIDNRHQQIRAITGNWTSYNVVAYNSLRRCRQTGISGSRECYGNEIYGDSFAPNSYLVSFINNAEIYRNKIFGLGHSPVGIGGGTTHDTMVRNNFIYVNAWAPEIRDDEYYRLSGVSGIRWQIYNDEEFVGVNWDNNIITDNVIVAKAWAGASYIRALWLSQGQYANGNRVENNIVKVEAMSDDIDSENASYCFTCIDINSSDEILYSWDFDLSIYEPTPSTLIADNRFITNMSYLTCGTAYATGSNVTLYRNTFEKIESYNRHYMPFRLGYWNLAAVNNKIIDSITGPGVDLGTPPRNGTYTIEAHLELDVGVSSQRAYVDANTGAPLANRTVYWFTDGGGSGAFTTDGSGEAYREWITTHSEHLPGEPGISISQAHNTTVTFVVDGYEPVVKNITDIQGAGPAILFGEGGKIIVDDPNLVAEDFRGIAIQDANTIRLSFWSYAGFDGAEIYRSDKPNGPFSLIKTESGPSPCLDVNLLPDTVYYYRIRLFRNGSFGPLSEVIALKTDDVVVEDLRGGAIQNANTVLLNFWSYSEFDGAEIYRSTEPNGPFSLLKTEYDPPPFLDSGLWPDTTYYYRIRLIQNGHFGPVSEIIELKTDDVVVEGFGGGAIQDANTIRLTFWSYSEYDGAEIYRSDEPDGPFDFIKAGYGPGPYFDSGLQPDTVYYYKIRLLQGWRPGPFSDVIALKTDDVVAEGFGGGAYQDANTIRLTFWSYSEFDGAEIYRADNSDGPFTLIRIEYGPGPYFDYGLWPDTTYYYFIRLIQKGRAGQPSGVVALKTSE